MLKYRRLCLSFVFLIGLLGLANAADCVLDAAGPSPFLTTDVEPLPFWLVFEIPIVGVIGAAVAAFALAKLRRNRLVTSHRSAWFGALNTEPQCSGNVLARPMACTTERHAL